MKIENFHKLHMEMRGPPREVFSQLLMRLQGLSMCRSARLSGGAQRPHGTQVFILQAKEFGTIQVTTGQVENDISDTSLTWRFRWCEWPLERVLAIINPIVDETYTWRVTINCHENYNVGLDPLNAQEPLLEANLIDRQVVKDAWCRYPATVPLNPSCLSDWKPLTPATYLHEEVLQRWGADDARFAAAKRVVPDMRVMRLKTGRWIICPCEGLGLPAINDRLRLMYGALRGIEVQPIPTTFYDADWKLPLGIGVGVPVDQGATP
jgi:hypothetical protein